MQSRTSISSAVLVVELNGFLLLRLLLQVLSGANGCSAVEQQWCRSDELLSIDYDQLLSQPCYAAGGFLP
jgi:hypothetical protein